MSKKYLLFLKDKIDDFVEIVINLFIFLPYFFSVSTLFKTLFRPWKNLRAKKTDVGFTFSEWGNRFTFNLISSFIGFVMRSCIISFYFLLQSVLMFFLPFISLIYFLLIPLLYFLNRYKKTPEEEKQLIKEEFVSKHLLKPENVSLVEDWFEKYYQKYIFKNDWWKLSNLLSYPPLARDWAMGFTPNLDSFASDLAHPSYLDHINNIVDRDSEIAQIEQILSKSSSANVVIVGDEGVGKHTIVDALAKKIYLGKTNVNLMYRRILKINMEKVGDDTKLFELLLKEAEEAGNIILFIDNFEKYLTHGISLEKYALSNRLQLIGMTTPFFYQKYIFPDEKMNRFFSKVDVHEVSKKEALEILLDKFYDLERYHHVLIPYETITEAIDKSEFYITYIPFPEKAVDLLDTACADVHSKSATSFQKAVKKQYLVTPEAIANVLTQKTKVPVIITAQMKEKLLRLEDLLAKKVFDQSQATEKLSSALRRSFLLAGKRKKPLATFLFLGPTGVGKTATAKAIASVFFSGENEKIEESRYLIRFDMSNYQSTYDIPKLIGDSTTGDPGLLTAAIREQLYGVLLLDELEKANKNLLNIFLTVIDEGYFTDGFGKRVDCKNLVIIATSNAKDESVFPPEFINRFDGVITFNRLSENTLKLISKKILSDLANEVYKLHKVKITIQEDTVDRLIKDGYDPRYGARNMERVIRDEIEDKVAKIILEGKVKEGETVNL